MNKVDVSRAILGNFWSYTCTDRPDARQSHNTPTATILALHKLYGGKDPDLQRYLLLSTPDPPRSHELEAKSCNPETLLVITASRQASDCLLNLFMELFDLRRTDMHKHKSGVPGHGLGRYGSDILFPRSSVHDSRIPYRKCSQQRWPLGGQRRVSWNSATPSATC